MLEDDSDDDKPLLFSLNAAKGSNSTVKTKSTSKGMMSKAKIEVVKTVTTSGSRSVSRQGFPATTADVEDSEDDDYEKPLSYAFSIKRRAVAPTKVTIPKKWDTKQVVIDNQAADGLKPLAQASHQKSICDKKDSIAKFNNLADSERIFTDNQALTDSDDNDDKPLLTCALSVKRDASLHRSVAVKQVTVETLSRSLTPGDEEIATGLRVYTKRKRPSDSSVSVSDSFWKKLKRSIALQRLKQDADAVTIEGDSDDMEDDNGSDASMDEERDEDDGDDDDEDDGDDDDDDDDDEEEEEGEEEGDEEVDEEEQEQEEEEADDDDDDDEGNEEDEDDDDEDFDFSLGKRSAKKKNSKSRKPLQTAKAVKNVVRKVVEARKSKVKQRKKMKGKQEGPGQKWTSLEHNGVVFPPPYTPHGIKLLYKGNSVDLTPEQEEVATMFAVMRETEYVTKPTFLANFWSDWKKLLGPNHVIQDLEGCDFSPIHNWILAEKETKNSLSSGEKKRMKEEKQKQEDKYMWALVDGVKEKVGNFRVEPPGLFRGRGEHPKMGRLKRRIFPEDIVINIGKDATVPECPISGHRWKEIRHDNTVTWLAYWNDPINVREQKYVFLSPSSNLKGQSDKEKYEKARILKDYIEDIRKTYTKNFASSDLTTQQIAVATYLIDRLALRAGNEKEDDEADTVGCCSLKVEHVKLVPPSSIEFDFLGKDSIRYFNIVEVIRPVYQAIGDFKTSKSDGDDLFDRLDTNKLNAHLKSIMPQLTAKVFRTYNASITLDTLIASTDGHLIPEKVAAYQRANKEVAILCNHQRTVSKSHGAQMEKLEAKLAELGDLLNELEKDLKTARKGKPPRDDEEGKPKWNQNPEALEKKIAQTKQRIEKVKLDMSIKDDLKTVALGTSKINYMDPRITVAWCKRHEVPIEKIFNKSLLGKFSWAMDVDMAFHF